MLFCYFSANDMDVDTAGEFARGVRGRGLLLPLRTHLAQAPADRRRAGIRQQYRCWVWAWDRVLDVGPGRIRAVWLDDKGGYPILADVPEGPAPEEAGD